MYFSIASLVLGLIAWAIPIATLISKRAATRTSVGLSFLACSLSLLSQLFDIQARSIERNWIAIEDTVGTVVWVAMILVMVTAFFNAFAMRKAPK